MTFERENLKRLGGYVSGEQPSRAKAKLNTNENPFPPFDAVLRVLAGINGEMLRRYPDPTARAFRAEAACLHGLIPDNIIATNGGDELLRLALTTFLPPGSPLGLAEPSYSLYPVLAAVHDSPICAVPLGDDWSAPVNIALRWNAAGAKLAILVNPHAPSGRLTSVEELAAVARAFDGVLLIDEAYVDFVDPGIRHDSIAPVSDLDNVLLLRTMSKGYSLAGLRLGYGIGSPRLIAPMLSKTKDSYNVDVVSQKVGRRLCTTRRKRPQARRSSARSGSVWRGNSRREGSPVRLPRRTSCLRRCPHGTREGRSGCCADWRPREFTSDGSIRNGFETAFASQLGRRSRMTSFFPRSIACFGRIFEASQPLHQNRSPGWGAVPGSLSAPPREQPGLRPSGSRCRSRWKPGRTPSSPILHPARLRARRPR